MKKSIILTIALCGVMLSGALSAHALVCDFYDEKGLEGLIPVMAWDLTGTHNSFANAYTYDHVLGGIPNGSTLSNVTLSITHSGNASSRLNRELWLVGGNQCYQIGKLSASPLLEGWETDVFAIEGDVLNSISNNNNWKLEVAVWDTQALVPDGIFLKDSVLKGNYSSPEPEPGSSSPVPEPGSLMLIGSGLLGLVRYAGRKVRK